MNVRHTWRHTLPCFTLITALVVVANPSLGEQEAPLPSGKELAEQINTNHFGKPVSRLVNMELIDREERQRTRSFRIYRDFQPNSSRLAIYVVAPPDMKHVSFLSFDYFEPGHEDEQWLYEPVRQTARRLAQVNRKDSFLGSEFSIEDIKKVNRVEVAEYEWKTLGETKIDGRRAFLLEQLPATPELAKNIGYGRILNTVDAEWGLRMKIQFWNPKGEMLKTFRMRKPLEHLGGWFATTIEATNHQTRDRTLLRFEETSTEQAIDDAVFTIRHMKREAPH
jgi:hypothetical protein